jgi:hypothetical protein
MTLLSSWPKVENPAPVGGQTINGRLPTSAHCLTRAQDQVKTSHLLLTMTVIGQQSLAPSNWALGLSSAISICYEANLSVGEVTKLCFETSRLLLFHIQRLLDSNPPLPLPNLASDTWLRMPFSLLSRPGTVVSDAELMLSFKLYCSRRGDTVDFPYIHHTSSQTITYLVGNCKVNIATHIDRIYKIVVRRWLFASFHSRGLPRKGANQMSGSIYSTLFDGRQPEGDNTDITDDEVVPVEPTPDALEETGDPTDEKTVRFIREARSANTDWRTRLRFIHDTNRKVYRLGGRLSLLLPVYSADAKYITVDTNVLHSLLGSKKGTGVDATKFGKNQIVHWVRNFRLPASLIPHDDTPDTAKRFGFMMLTDGVGVSMTVNRFVWVPRPPKTPKLTAEESRKKAQKLAQERFEDQVATVRSAVYDPVSDNFNCSFVGVDQGNDALATVVREVGGEYHSQQRFSAGRFYEESSFNHCKMKQVNALRRSGVGQWWQETPTLKNGFPESTLDVVEYLFGPHGNINKIFELKLRKRTRKLRWRAYIHQKKTLRRFAREVLGNLPSDKPVVVAFGNGCFSNTSGSRSVPRSKQLRRFIIEEALRRRWRGVGVYVIGIWEFNTSQVCSNCHSAERLVGLRRRRVFKKYFVRGCTQTSCRTIWNR